jgi:hypothetical protein
VVRRGLRKSQEGPARLVLGLWRSSSRWDSGRASMERDTVRKLMSILKKLFCWLGLCRMELRDGVMRCPECGMRGDV